MEYKTLADKIESKGFTYTLVSREKDIAIYEQTKAGHIAMSYEVIRVKRHNGFVIAGTTIAPSEVYPSAEKWGLDGFTLITLAEAYKKMDWMQKHQLSEDVVVKAVNSKNEVVDVTKRKRGRPRKVQTEAVVLPVVKRGRGRPRKNSVA